MSHPATMPHWADTPTTLRTEPPSALQDAGHAVGDRLPAQYLNWLFGVICDWLDWLFLPHDYMSQPVLLAPVSITSGVETPIPFDNSTYYKTGMWDPLGDTTKLTAPITGNYRISVSVEWDTTSTGRRDVWILQATATIIAGSSIGAPPADASHETLMNVTATVRMGAGTFCQVMVLHDVGSPINLCGARCAFELISDG